MCVCVSTISQETGRQFPLTQEPFHKPQTHLLYCTPCPCWFWGNLCPGAQTLPCHRYLSRTHHGTQIQGAVFLFLLNKHNKRHPSKRVLFCRADRLNPFQCQSTFKVCPQPSRRTTFGLSEFTRSTKSSLVLTTGQVLSQSPATQT